MKIIEYPIKSEWTNLCARPTFETNDISSIVNDILDKVKSDGDKALLKLASELDGVNLSNLTVTEAEIESAKKHVSPELKAAIQVAYNNIYLFHKSQELNKEVIETTEGVSCWREARPIDKVGLYIPGGSAPLFSTVLMLGIPAKIADCKEIILCSPPQKDGSIADAILYAADLIGVRKIFKTGGAQAIGAMTFGTESVPAVYKIFGPGNQFVTKAKEICQLNGIAIDMPAGPSEVLVIADDSAIPSFVAADLLSQAEHGADSQVILLSNSKAIIQQCLQELNAQLEELPRKELAEKALKKSKAILLQSMDECIQWSNTYAPEHLILACSDFESMIDKISNAGSVFLGNYSCESAGDYASGTNHTLPTNGYARQFSGVSLDSFQKKITFQNLSEQGILNIGPVIEVMAENEELIAHKNAVSKRLAYLKKKSQ